MDVTFEWSEFIKVSELRRDLMLSENGGLKLKWFDRKYPMLKNWGCYMFTASDKNLIVYIGKTSRIGRSFRNRLREELHPTTTKFHREIGARGIDIDSLYVKVATIKSYIYNGRTENEVDLSLVEIVFTCATGPLYNPHEPAHAKVNFEIHNIGNHSPLPELLKMKRGEECKNVIKKSIILKK